MTIRFQHLIAQAESLYIQARLRDAQRVLGLDATGAQGAADAPAPLFDQAFLQQLLTLEPYVTGFNSCFLNDKDWDRLTKWSQRLLGLIALQESEPDEYQKSVERIARECQQATSSVTFMPRESHSVDIVPMRGAGEGVAADMIIRQDVHIDREELEILLADSEIKQAALEYVQYTSIPFQHFHIQVSDEQTLTISADHFITVLAKLNDISIDELLTTKTLILNNTETVVLNGFEYATLKSRSNFIQDMFSGSFIEAANPNEIHLNDTLTSQLTRERVRALLEDLRLHVLPKCYHGRALADTHVAPSKNQEASANRAIAERRSVQVFIELMDLAQFLVMDKLVDIYYDRVLGEYETYISQLGAANEVMALTELRELFASLDSLKKIIIQYGAHAERIEAFDRLMESLLRRHFTPDGESPLEPEDYVQRLYQYNIVPAALEDAHLQTAAVLAALAQTGRVTTISFGVEPRSEAQLRALSQFTSLKSLTLNQYNIDADEVMPDLTAIIRNNAIEVLNLPQGWLLRALDQMSHGAGANVPMAGLREIKISEYEMRLLLNSAHCMSEVRDITVKDNYLSEFDDRSHVQRRGQQRDQDSISNDVFASMRHLGERFPNMQRLTLESKMSSDDADRMREALTGHRPEQLNALTLHLARSHHRYSRTEMFRRRHQQQTVSKDQIQQQLSSVLNEGCVVTVKDYVRPRTLADAVVATSYADLGASVDYTLAASRATAPMLR